MPPLAVKAFAIYAITSADQEYLHPETADDLKNVLLEEEH